MVMVITIALTLRIMSMIVILGIPRRPILMTNDMGIKRWLASLAMLIVPTKMSSA